MGTRERLVESAAGLLDEGGPEAVTLREVGARSGVSHNTPYRHFSDKRDLLAAVAAQALHELAGHLRTADAGPGDGADRVRRAALAYVGWAADRPSRFRLVFGAWGGEPHEELGAAADDAAAALRGCVRRALDEGVLVGELERVTALVWALGHGAVDLDLAGHLRKRPGSPSPADLVDELVARISAGASRTS